MTIKIKIGLNYLISSELCGQRKNGLFRIRIRNTLIINNISVYKRIITREKWGSSLIRLARWDRPVGPAFSLFLKYFCGKVVRKCVKHKLLSFTAKNNWK